MLQWVYKRPDPCIEYSGWENSKPSKSDIHLILRVGFAVPVTFTSSASSFFSTEMGKKVLKDLDMEDNITNQNNNKNRQLI